jgi:hypothetical protein
MFSRHYSYLSYKFIIMDRRLQGALKFTVEQINNQIKNEKRNLILEGSGPIKVLDIGTWKCLSCSLVFKAQINSVKNGQGCRPCSIKKRSKKYRGNEHLISDFLKLNGINVSYLSGQYINSKSQLTYKCNNLECGHIFKTMFQTFQAILKREVKYGCQKCSRNARRITPKEINEKLASENRTIRLIEDSYITNSKESLWICSKDKIPHTFNSSISSVLWNKNGCRICDNKRKKESFTFTPDQAQATIIERGVPHKWISGEYTGAHSVLLWECNNKETPHQFLSKYVAVVHNLKHCPICTQRKSESLVLNIIKSLTGITLTKDTPDWIINPKTNKQLELDGVSHEHKLAVEIQGRQHFEYDEYFHNSEQDFLDQKERDLYKKEKCKSLGYILIVVPTLEFFKNKIPAMEKEIKKQLKKAKFQIS